MAYQLGYDWLVHYRADDPEDEQSAILPIFDVRTAALALEAATEMLGAREIIGVMRRDLIANADEILGSSRPN